MLLQQSCVVSLLLCSLLGHLLTWQTYRPFYFQVCSRLLAAKRSQIHPGNPGLETSTPDVRWVSLKPQVPACFLIEFLAKMLQDWLKVKSSNADGQVMVSRVVGWLADNKH